MNTFVALDFETATISRTSACSLGIVVGLGSRIVERKHFLIRPPRRQFTFTHIHGISWDDVCDAPSFGDIWAEVRAYLRRADFLAAHKASFDEGVLRRCCEVAGVTPPRRPFVCTMNLARAYMNLYPTGLSAVCEKLRIPLKHHDALSDAEACAKIVIEAQKNGWKFQ